MAITQVPLTGSTVITTNAAPVMGRFNRYNPAAGALSVTLPALSGQNVGARTSVQKYMGDVSANTVTFTCAGTDRFDDGATASFTLGTTGEQRELQVISVGATKRWKFVGTLVEGADISTVSAQVATNTAAIAGKQNSDADLTAIATLTADDDDFLQRKSGGWANRSIDEVRTDLAVKIGLPKNSGGGTHFGLPGNYFTGSSTSAASVNQVRYTWFYTTYPITLTQWQIDITTAPASSGNLRFGIYVADGQLQPVGAPLYDSGSVAVASGYVGNKSASMAVALNPGGYLVALNVDVAMTFRSMIAPARFVADPYTGSMLSRGTAVQTFGALPDPGTPWTSVVTSTTGTNQHVIFKWTEP